MNTHLYRHRSICCCPSVFYRKLVYTPPVYTGHALLVSKFRQSMTTKGKAGALVSLKNVGKNNRLAEGTLVDPSLVFTHKRADNSTIELQLSARALAHPQQLDGAKILFGQTFGKAFSVFCCPSYYVRLSMPLCWNRPVRRPGRPHPRPDQDFGGPSRQRNYVCSGTSGGLSDHCLCFACV